MLTPDRRRHGHGAEMMRLIYDNIADADCRRLLVDGTIPYRWGRAFLLYAAVDLMASALLPLQHSQLVQMGAWAALHGYRRHFIIFEHAIYREM